MSGDPQPSLVVEPRPVTGHPGVDAALAALDALDAQPISDHHAPLAQAHEALSGALDDAS